MLRHLKRSASQTLMSDSKIQRIQMNVTKSKSDKKEYRLIYLENGLKALLIHHDWQESSNEHDDHKRNESISESQESGSDSEEEIDDIEPEREKLAAVALCVGTGSFKDPSSMQGLAHFVEHMIFMGSEKYPKENELDKYLSANGGGSNALTECEHTLFYFDIVEQHLVPTLDRFSNLFISPLMLHDSIDREIEAVESEFHNNINDDDSRIYQLIASKATGPAATFTWGNLKSLKEDVDTEKLYAAAHEFRKKYYVANNMYLCVQSAKTLDELQEIVEEHFSDVKSSQCDLVEEKHLPNPFTRDFYDKIYYVKPKTDKCKIYITFVIPSMEKHYKSKPHDYLAYILQHEGEGSLTSYLKRNLLALRVEAGAEDQSFESNSIFTLFGIDILLTEKGYECIDKVLEAVFSVILLLKETSIEEHKRAFCELQKIHDIRFDYREEQSSSDNTEEYAVNMHYYNSEDIITGPRKFFEFDAHMVSKLIDLLNEGKFNLLLLTDKHDRYRCVEKWFGTEYDEMDFPIKYRELWNNRKLLPDFRMPTPNEFICQNFDIHFNTSSCQNIQNTPEKVTLENVELWYKMDGKFLLPHGFINCYFISPKIVKSIKNALLVSLYSLSVKHYLTEKLYPANCAGLGHVINSAERGLLVKLSGYNEKLPVLLDIITKELKNIPNRIQSTVFETYRKQLKKIYYNNLISPKFLAKDCRLTIVDELHDFSYDRYKMIDELSFEDLVTFAHEFTDELKVQLLVIGNFKKSEAMEIATCLKNNLKYAPVKDEKSLLSRTRKIPSNNSNVFYVKNMLPDDINSTTTNYFQVGKSTIRTQCLIEFIEKLMEEPLFDILRTKEQLGYHVACSHRLNNGIIGFTLFVQSQESKHATVEVNERFQTFLRDDFFKIINELSDGEFNDVKNSLIKLKKLEELELESESNRHWAEITSREYLFDRLDLEAKMLELLTKGDVQQFFNETLINSPRLSIQVIGSKQEEKNEHRMTENDDHVLVLKILEGSDARDENVIANVETFRNSLELYEACTTTVDGVLREEKS